MVKNLPAMKETWVDPQIGKIPRRREWQPTLGFLPGEFHGQSSLAGYSPRDHKESETTEQRRWQWLLLSPTLVMLLVDPGRFPTQARIGLVIRKSQWLESFSPAHWPQGRFMSFWSGRCHTIVLLLHSGSFQTLRCVPLHLAAHLYSL